MTSVKNVVVIGAGNIGTMIAYMLPNSMYNVTVIDGSKKVLAKKILHGIVTKHADVQDSTVLHTILDSADYVINAGPYFLASQISFIAGSTKTHYFDLTEDVEQTQKVRDYANDIFGNTVAFVPQCGLAPGFISIVANHLASQFDEVLDVKMRVGALPKFPNNALKYNMTWSTDGLINEYLHPCNVIKHNKLVSVEPLEGYETFSLDGDLYEAFNTSGGLGTLCETWENKVSSMDYKTVRYPGHRDLMKFLIDDMKLGDDGGAQLKAMMNKAIPITTQDVVLIFVAVNGYKEGRLIQETWSKKIYGQEMFGHKWSAIQLTTAAGVCSMMDLHYNKCLPQIGFVKQEDAHFNDFMSTSSAKIYN